MAECQNCCEEISDCRCPQDCVDCHQSVHLESDCEWPEGEIRCWGCAHDRIEKLEKQLKTLKKRVQSKRG